MNKWINSKKRKFISIHGLTFNALHPQWYHFCPFLLPKRICHLSSYFHTQSIITYYLLLHSLPNQDFITFKFATIFPPSVDNISFFPVPSPTFVVFCGIYDNHSDWSKIKYQCCFDLHFLYGQGYWGFLQIFIGHSYLFFWELSHQFIRPFVHWAVDSLIG
jgi:hypothetical protein